MENSLKIRLIRESSGFGYTSYIPGWIAENGENAVTLKDLRNGKAVVLPETTAKNLYNVVDVSTGNIVSSHYSLVGITKEEVASKYLEVAEAPKEIKSDTKVEIKSETKKEKNSQEN